MQLLLMNHVAITFASKGLSFNGVDHLSQSRELDLFFTDVNQLNFLV